VALTASLIFPLLVACNGDGEAGRESDTSVREASFAINTVLDFGAIADGVTDNSPFVQAALNAAAAAGGGSVHIPEGVYGIARPLILRSGVHLIGSGRGQTVLRSLVMSWGEVEPGAGVTGTVAMIAANDASVTDLTVDLSIAGTHSNGVVILPDGPNLTGAPSTNCTIERVEVIGGGNYHAYMIWNYRGRRIRIVDNVVDGRVISPVASSQEGIESYGGRDILVSSNVIRNVGNAALNFGSAGLPDTSIDGLVVIGNDVSNVGVGINIGTWMDPTGPQNVINARIEYNDFADIWHTGIYVPTQPGTEIRGLSITGNGIRNVGSENTQGLGIFFNGRKATATLPASASMDTLIWGNRIANVRGPNATGVVVVDTENVAVLTNYIGQVANTGIYAFGSKNLTVQENIIEDVQRYGLISSGPDSSTYVVANNFREWDSSGDGFSGVTVRDADTGSVRDNIFRRSAFIGSAVRIEATSSNVIVFGNELITEADATDGKILPFVNAGIPSNLGSIHVASGATTLAISNVLVTPNSRVRLQQTSGEPWPVSVSAESGKVRILSLEPAQGDETFRYEIDP
jgi:hypothetical protein